jgi:hypothetical protein
MKRLISTIDRKRYSLMKEIIETLNVPIDYKWLISDIEAYPENAEIVEVINKGYLIISNKELLSLLTKEDFQWIWGVFSLFTNDINDKEILSSKKPFIVFGNDEVYGVNPVVQHPLAILEIDAYDSSYVFMSSKEEIYIDRFKRLFPESKEQFDKSLDKVITDAIFRKHNLRFSWINGLSLFIFPIIGIFGIIYGITEKSNSFLCGLLLIFTIIQIVNIISLKVKLRSNKVSIIRGKLIDSKIVRTNEGKGIKGFLVGLKLILNVNNSIANYYYYYINGPEGEFIKNKKYLAEAEDVELTCFKGTRIIKEFKYDNTLYPLNYVERKENSHTNHMTYSSLLGGKDITSNNNLVEYEFSDVVDVFLKSEILDGLYAIDENNKYVLIQSDITSKGHRICKIDNQVYSNTQEFKEWLLNNKFVIENKIKSFAGLDLVDPEQFMYSIDTIK